MAHKSLDCEFTIKADATGERGFAGYASVFGVVDTYNERVLPGAFNDAIADFLRNGHIGWGHQGYEDLGHIVAYPTAAHEDDNGLYIEAAWHSTQAAQDARTVLTERMEAGKSMRMSIGYDVPSGGWRTASDGVVELAAIAPLHEVSLVPVPANRAALVTATKSAVADAVRELLSPPGAPAKTSNGEAERIKRLRDLRLTHLLEV